jgi:hypothetical protein
MYKKYFPNTMTVDENLLSSGMLYLKDLAKLLKGYPDQEGEIIGVLGVREKQDDKNIITILFKEDY